ncbi:hypothetical protein TcCL_NonESM10719 [Trypanosoma cruzi]|uniref:Uncharacterized protein n=1 Tax=Trypanosoma cruzi (strain CL Brener) TaxID=353153 RepID=Q4CZC2_TRYCC|nr:hypothetical protein Tc00.1047053506723.30 [Trypanosoma cruzi]EAN85626.1 hypothetical protein Tc00.1047053506723.30 [Trypanosoma cruzi]RNC39877.1 hypothetical protein TcCL_NonESM10719 [Trypanosoma cruzi]|eukprot:XP_807477.1 hypothetical protein [Trypanosoma cruzi strain CL Brener]
MDAEIHYSATPFKLLPKQSASDTVISHTLPVHCRGNDADTNGIICTKVGSTNSQHSRTKLTLSVHPTPRLKRPRQAPINKILKREKTNSLQALQGSTATPPTGACIPMLAAVQASLLRASRGVEHLPDHLALKKQASRRCHPFSPQMVLPR